MLDIYMHGKQPWYRLSNTEVRITLGSITFTEEVS